MNIEMMYKIFFIRALFIVVLKLDLKACFV